MGGGAAGLTSSAALTGTTFDTLPFDIAFADLSWEFTLFGDVDVSTGSVGLPAVPAGLAPALHLSWVADAAVRPGRYCPPRHRMPFNSINEGLRVGFRV
jgi:hypothetical protein